MEIAEPYIRKGTTQPIPGRIFFLFRLDKVHIFILRLALRPDLLTFLHLEMVEQNNQ